MKFMTYTGRTSDLGNYLVFGGSDILTKTLLIYMYPTRACYLYKCIIPFLPQVGAHYLNEMLHVFVEHEYLTDSFTLSDMRGYFLSLI